MVEGYVGAASYRDGINAYLKKFAFANATGEGFWTTMAAVTRKPVDRVLASFITQSSMPLVNVETRCAGGEHRAGTVAAADLGRCAGVDDVGHSGLLQARARRKSAASRMRAAVCAARRRRSSTAARRGSSRTSTAAATTARRTKPDDLQALGEAARNGQLTPLEQTTLLEDLWALVRTRRAEHRGFSVVVEPAREEPAEPGDRHRAVAHQLHLGMARGGAAAAGVRALGPPDGSPARWIVSAGRRNRAKPEDIQSLRVDRDLHAGKRRTRSRRAARGAAPRRPSRDGRRAAACEHRRYHAAARGDRWRRRRCTSRYLSRMTGERELQANQAAVPGGARPSSPIPELGKRTLAYATSTDIRTQDAPIAHPVADAAAVGQRGDLGTPQDQLGDESSARSASFRAFPPWSDRLSTSATPDRETTSSRFFSTHRVAGTDRTLQQSLERIAALRGDEIGAGRRPGGIPFLGGSIEQDPPYVRVAVLARSWSVSLLTVLVSVRVRVMEPSQSAARLPVMLVALTCLVVSMSRAYIPLPSVWKTGDAGRARHGERGFVMRASACRATLVVYEAGLGGADARRECSTILRLLS